jgi:S-adenosylmethionine:tRNA ribosyltransferase-isomerase
MPDAFDATLSDYDYELPSELIARWPTASRDGARMLQLGSEIAHKNVVDLPTTLRKGDLLVVNDTKVMPARVRARRSTGGAVEVFFLEEGEGVCRALVRPSKKLKVGESLTAGPYQIHLESRGAEGEWRVKPSVSSAQIMAEIGEMPLPPYLDRAEEAADKSRYQTVFADQSGAVAAPTASLHLSDALLQELADRGVGLAKLTLHVGIGTFRNLRPSDLANGELHPERFNVPQRCVDQIRACRMRGGRVIAVGTTVTRTLESATQPGERVPEAGEGVTRLFLREGARFSCVDGLMTNFHLPRSSLLMLVCAFAGRERVLSAYAEAISQEYRFYSYGDSMLIL